MDVLEYAEIDRPDGFYVAVHWARPERGRVVTSARVLMRAHRLSNAIDIAFPDRFPGGHPDGVTIYHWSPGRGPVHIATIPREAGEDCISAAIMAFVGPDLMTLLSAELLAPMGESINLYPCRPNPGDY